LGAPCTNRFDVGQHIGMGFPAPHFGKQETATAWQAAG